jgi:enoyl-CoA hydratase/carnithine racemase
MWTDIEPEAGVAVVTRPRPHLAVLRIASEPLGVLRIFVKRAIRQAFGQLEADPDVRCVVITGTGPAFSVGSDVRELERETGWLLKAEHEENALNDQIEYSRLPVIAAINGHALGGGAVLPLACDMRLAAASARIGLPDVRVRLRQRNAAPATAHRAGPRPFPAPDGPDRRGTRGPADGALGAGRRR